MESRFFIFINLVVLIDCHLDLKNMVDKPKNYISTRGKKQDSPAFD